MARHRSRQRPCSMMLGCSFFAKQLVRQSACLPARNANFESGAQKAPSSGIHVAEIEQINLGLAKACRSAQVADEFKIFRKQIRAYNSQHRSQQSRVPIQAMLKGPVFVFLRGAGNLWQKSTWNCGQGTGEEYQRGQGASWNPQSKARCPVRAPSEMNFSSHHPRITMR